LISKYFKQLKSGVKSEFGKNVLTIFSGASISQIIPFIISPILTRIYSPDDFGLLALFVSVFSIISIISTLQYEAAIVLPKKDEIAINLVALCFIITIIVSLLTLLTVITFNAKITGWLGNNNLSIWLYFIPIPIFLTGVFNTLNNWASRKKQFKRIAFRNISQSTATGGSKVLFGFLKLTNIGLIVGTLIGQFTSTYVLAWLTFKDDKKILKNIKKEKILAAAKEYRNFPKYVAWQGFFDMFNSSGTNFIISAFWGTHILGLYSFSLGIMQKPLSLIGSSVAQVYYQKASEDYNQGKNIWAITKKLIFRLSLISIFIFTPVAIGGPKLFSFVFGEEWLSAGIYARILIPWLMVRFIGSPITSSINIIGKQKSFFKLTLLFNILFPSLFYFSFKVGIPFNISLLIVSILSGIYLFSVIFWIKSIINNERN